MPECPNKWQLDVNDRYARGVGVVLSLSSAALILPIFFLKDIVNITSTQSFANVLSNWTYLGWFMLSVSIVSGIIYYFCSAKWVKLAWDKEADIFSIPVGKPRVELYLNISYFLMMSGFIIGLGAMIIYMMTFTIRA